MGRLLPVLLMARDLWTEAGKSLVGNPLAAVGRGKSGVGKQSFEAVLRTLWVGSL